MDNSVVIAGWGEGIRGLNGNGKHTIKINLKMTGKLKFKTNPFSKYKVVILLFGKDHYLRLFFL